MCFIKFCVSTCFVLYKWTLTIKKLFTTHACVCFYVMELRKQRNIFCTSEPSPWFTQKNNFCIMNKIKLVWFYSLYINYFLNKNTIFLCFKNIFYPVTLENISRILNNSVYFQNIVVCNEPFKRYIFKLFQTMRSSKNPFDFSPLLNQLLGKEKLLNLGKISLSGNNPYKI